MKLQRRTAGAIAMLGLAFSLMCAPCSALAEEYSGSVTMSGDRSGAVPVTIKTVEYGASWDYGSIPFVHGWSNLMSGSRWHSSTVTAGGNSSYDKKGPGVQSKAELWLNAFSTYAAYYNIW